MLKPPQKSHETSGSKSDYATYDTDTGDEDRICQDCSDALGIDW